MKMRRAVRISRTLVLPLFAALTILAGTVWAQEDGYPFRLSNFSLELLGGYSKLNPMDFNAYASAEEAYVQSNYVTRINYYRALYGTAYQATVVRNGDSPFKPVKDGLAYGFRLRYELSPSLGLSFGIQLVDRQQRSNVGVTVAVQDPDPAYISANKPQAYAYQNSGFLLGVSAWVPEVAAHFGWAVGRGLRFEALIGGGPMFISCHSVNTRLTSTTDASGAVSSNLTTIDMRGMSTGFSGELAGRIYAKTGGFLDFFAELSYCFREGAELSGPGSSQSIDTDASGPKTPVTTTWNGIWNNRLTTITSVWGKYSVIAPQNQIPSAAGSGIIKYVLNLSGFQLKAGLTIHL
jgi:hypothetical protein